MEDATISTTINEISSLHESPNYSIISLMDRSLHTHAVKGEVGAFPVYAVKGEVVAFPEHNEEYPLDQLVTPNKNTILHIHITARSKDDQASLDFVKAILDMCPNLLWQVNSKDETLLHIASRHGHDDIVNLLIEKSKDPRFIDHENGPGGAMQLLKRITKAKDTALHEAVRFKHIHVVKILIKENVRELHEINSGGETPFHLAVERGYEDIVKEMKHSAKSFQAYDGPSGRTTLHAAVLRKDLELTKLMLELENNLTKKADEKGWNPFHYAADRCYSEIVSEILNCDESVVYCFTADENKMTAIHLIARSTACNATKRLETLRELISRCPCCAELVDDRNWNFLHFAVDKGNYEAFALIIENPSLFNLINERNSDDNTPLLHFFAFERFGRQKENFYQYFKEFYTQSHPKVDTHAFNRQNRNFLDIMMSRRSLDEYAYEDEDEVEANEELYWMLRIQELLESEVITSGLRIVDEKSEVVDGQQKWFDKDISEIKGEKDEEMRSGPRIVDKKSEVKEGYLVAAALIATVSFTAGLTVPGGYKNDVGTALLIKSAAFQGFAVTNTLAFICSSCAVLSHIFPVKGSESSNNHKFISNFEESRLTALAMVFMALAFITGSYAVLASSLELAISLCVIQCLFIGPFFFHKRDVILRIVDTIIGVPLRIIVYMYKIVRRRHTFWY